MGNWIVQHPQGTVYVSQPSLVNDWKIENPQGAAYVLQEVYSSFVYALNGQQVYALDGSLIQSGFLWANQLDKNGVWINQMES